MRSMVFKGRREKALQAQKERLAADEEECKERLKADREAEKEQANATWELYEKKQLAFYSALVTGWLNTRMERDKSLLTLSATGVGLLITLLTKFNAPSGAVTYCYVGAIVCFCVCIGSVLYIFTRNATHLLKIHQSETAATKDRSSPADTEDSSNTADTKDGSKKGGTNDRVLEIFDYVAVGTFSVGIVLLAAIGISAAFSPDKKIEVSEQAERTKSMAGEKKSQDGTGGIHIANDSVNGVSGMKPTTTLQSLRESLNGAGKLKPTTPQSTPNKTGGTTSQNSNPPPSAGKGKGS